MLAKRSGICRQAGRARHWRPNLCGYDSCVASRAFLGAHEILQRGGLFRGPPTRRFQPLFGGHGRFDLLLRRRISAGGFLKGGQQWEKRY